jgi:serine/threonine-protein kinase
VSAFLAQDYVAADSLDLAVREYGPAPAGNVLRVATQLAGALDFAAAVHITHGALHPRDLLLSSDDTRLTGIGLTHALGRIGVVAPVRRPYTAPERIAGGEWDRRADVFSLAALMHELMWGKRVSGLGSRAAERLGDIAGTDPRALRDVFARALAENPADRYETALAFAEALKNACPDVAVEAEPATAAKRRPRREKEPRLPLDEGAAVAQAAASDVPPPKSPEPPARPIAAEVEIPPAVPTDDLPLVVTSSVAPDVVIADLEVSPEHPEPTIAHRPVTEVPLEPAPTKQAAAGPPGFITGYASEPVSALERTRSAAWPLVLALGVGIAIGFAGGFFSASREQPAATTTPAQEPTQSAAPKVEVGSQKAEGEVPKAETPKAEPPSNPKSETSNLKSEPASDGRLVVRTRPAGARVSVDGKDYGPAPATQSRPTHHVKITRDGYVTEERRVVVTSSRLSQSMTVDLAPVRAAAPRSQPSAAPERFVGSLAVDSRPTGAKVFMDGTLVGTTPMALPSVPVGSHAIRLEHEGYRHWSSSVRIVASEQNRVTASLER